jgi:predicted  nucleic acid-binding Zn-ribbon protein
MKEADLYVQDDYTKAEDALKRAKALVLQKKYKEAKAAAEEAVASALQAISRVDMQRTKMGEEVDQMILEGKKFLEEIKTLAVSAIRKKAEVGREKMEAAIGKYELEMVEIKEQRQAMETRVASDRLASLHNAMNTLKEEITAAIEAKDAAKKQ